MSEKSILSYLLPYRRKLILGLSGVVVFTLLSTLPPLLNRRLINDVAAPGAWNLLLGTVIMIMLIPILSVGLRFINIKLVQAASYQMVSDVRNALYRKILYLHMSFHQENSSGLLVNQLMDDVNMLLHLLTGDTVNIIVNMIVFFFSIAIVFILSPLIGFILISILILYVLAYRYYSQRIRTSTTLFRSVYDRINERLEETVTGVRHVRIFNQEEDENEVFVAHNEESLNHALLSRKNSIALGTVCNTIAGLGSALIASIGAWKVLNGTLDYGDVLAIGNYIWMALNPAIQLTNLAGQITEINVSVRRINHLLAEEPAIIESPEPKEPAENRGQVDFQDIHFAYVKGIPLYQGLNLEVKQGETIALVGHTGCGKTSLTSLLMRFWDIQKGSIKVDGLDIRDFKIKSLRDRFGVVLQAPILFEGTLADNIAYGKPNATREEVIRAAKVAEIYEMAQRLPQGFDTLMGSEGSILSMGEKQRINIARAVLKDPLILIMDEATSSLDSESEYLIQKALDKILKGRTSFVVAHRLSTITGADKIVVMDRGAIVEMGRHEELMKIENGHYAQLYNELKSKKEQD
jgi:ABC-type multidrug transport system fused ATPase/permease subunit